MSESSFDKGYARRKLELLLRDLNDYTADEFWREVNRVTSGATGLPSAEQLQSRVKELEAINLGLTKTLVEMEAENAELRNRGAVYYGLQKDEGFLLMNADTEQLEIYDSLRAAQRAVSTGQKIIRLRARRDDEGKA